MKKYILLLVTALLLTGLAGCSMTKNRYNHYGVVKYLENKYDDKFEYYEMDVRRRMMVITTEMARSLDL